MAYEVEYEKTYLAREIPAEVNGVDGVVLHDIMVPDTSRHPHLRLRHKGDKFTITKKVQLREGDSTEMSEETIPLEREEFEALEKCSTKQILKKRYEVVIDGYAAEVDIFGGALKGLVLIDFEFASKEEKDNFIPPTVCLADVSQEESTAGGYLAGKSYSDIKEFLDKYGYIKILGGGEGHKV